MKVVIAIDSLKGSLSSMEAGNAIKEGILKAHKDAEVIVKPLADGGEGTTDALIEGLSGERIDITVTGPLGEKIDAYYGFLPESKTAILEMAAAAGITLLPEGRKEPLAATTYGVGEMIRDAVKRGARDFIIGIGGSATNDGGIGMLKALGFEFTDAKGQPVGEGAKALKNVHSISSDHVLPELKDCHFKIACDVTNPLYGKNGATYIYGPQKGVTKELMPVLDEAMEQYAKVCTSYTGRDYADFPGSGAAGGLGFAFITFLPAELKSGINLILEAIGLEESLSDADYVVTGEGRLDHQTAMGKAPAGVAHLAKEYNATVIALAGAVTKDARACNAVGIDSFFCIQSAPVTLEEAMDKENAAYNMTLTAEQIFRLLPSK